MFLYCIHNKPETFIKQRKPRLEAKQKEEVDGQYGGEGTIH